MGPNEPKRAKAQRDWTIDHRGRPRSDNPYIREKIYSPDDFVRVLNFKEWAKQNPDKADVDNPYHWRDGSPQLCF
jgi:hypothetical protein